MQPTRAAKPRGNGRWRITARAADRWALATMKIAAAILIAAIWLLVASFRMEPFVDSGWSGSVQHGDSNAYFEAREKALTPKYRLQDYGVTLVFVGTAVGLLSRKRGVPAPATKFGFTLVAFAAPMLTVAGFVFDLLLGSVRQEFPPWADSLGIPLAGVPVIAAVLLVWSLAHLTYLSGVKKRSNVRLSLAALRGGNKWLLFVAAITVLFIVWSAAEGAYYIAVPGAVWLYYYVSIIAVRGHHGG